MSLHYSRSYIESYTFTFTMNQPSHFTLIFYFRDYLILPILSNLLKPFEPGKQDGDSR